MSLEKSVKMFKLQTSMVLWDSDNYEGLPSEIKVPNFTIEGATKGELVDKLLYHLELHWAILQNDGVEGIDYHKLAKLARDRYRNKTKPYNKRK